MLLRQGQSFVHIHDDSSYHLVSGNNGSLNFIIGYAYVCKGHAYSCCPIKYYPSCMWDCNNDFQTIKHERLSFNCSHSLQSIILLHHILRYWRNVNNKAWFCIDAVEEIPFQLELNGESEKKINLNLFTTASYFIWYSSSSSFFL